MQVEGIVKLFNVVRGTDLNTFHAILDQASSEDLVGCIALLLHLRDCRGGKGERDLGVEGLIYLCNTNSTALEMIRKLLAVLPEYGRWDDVVRLYKVRALRESILTVLEQQIIQDLIHLRDNVPVSLCAKWLPSEGSALDANVSIHAALCKRIRLTPRQYRKGILVPLRHYIDIVESKCCSGEWTQIDYNKVPSCAMHRLSKSFEKHDPIRFQEWKDGLATGETKVNAAQLFPHQIIAAYRTMYRVDPLYEAQWQVQLEMVRAMGQFRDSLVVCDVSGSMSSKLSGSKETCMDVSVALSILIASCTAAPFQNHIISFHSDPEWFLLDEKESLQQNLMRVLKMPWGGSTNLQAVFLLILAKCIRHRLTQDQIPKRIYIISDMQFNHATGERTNHQDILRQFHAHGYIAPQLVYWNVAATNVEVPITDSDTNAILLSGFSTGILKHLHHLEQFSTVTLIQDVLDSPRYAQHYATMGDRPRLLTEKSRYMPIPSSHPKEGRSGSQESVTQRNHSRVWNTGFMTGPTGATGSSY